MIECALFASNKIIALPIDKFFRLRQGTQHGTLTISFEWTCQQENTIVLHYKTIFHEKN
jgi:hypothetical protein